jgi:hypothetical protein
MRLLGKFAAGTIGLVAALAITPAKAEAAVFTFDTCVTGFCGDVTGAVVVTATDSGNNIDFTIENNTNGDIDYLRFLSAPLPEGTAVITNFLTTDTVGAPDASFGAGNDASIGYNVNLDFASAAALRFDAGEAVSFTLGSSTGFDLNVSAFSPALAHVISLAIGGQSVKLTTGGGSDPVTVPEPATMALFGLAALAGVRRARKQ